MKKISLKTAIDATFFAIIIIFSVLVYSTYNRAQLVKQNRLIVNHTSNVNDVLEKILSSTIDIETGARGYTITGEEDYLSVYTKGRENLKIWIDSLKSLNETDEIQLKKLDTLQRLIEAKKNINAEVISARREKGMDAAAEIVKSGRGKEIMDSIRVSVLDYQKSAVRILSINIKQTEENVKARNLNFILFTLATLTIVSFAYYKLRKNAKTLLQDKIIQENLLDELTLQNRQLNEFASITSHNLRSPAANITSLISTIDDDSTIDEYKMLFDMLKKIGQSLNDSLNQLMEVLHIRRNKLVEKETLDFQQIFNKTIDTLQGEMLKSAAVVKADFTNTPQLNYSRIYLESIFHNLISNALKYRDISRIPEINVRTETKGNHIILQVKDNGIGIDLSRHGSKIFGMNQRFTNHTDSKGIGLFMTKTQIESLNGKIAVASELNVGTTFTVTFTV